MNRFFFFFFSVKLTISSISFVQFPSRLFLVLLKACWLIGVIYVWFVTLNEGLRQSHGMETTKTTVSNSTAFTFLALQCFYNLIVNIVSDKLYGDYTNTKKTKNKTKHNTLCAKQNILRYYAFKLKFIEIKWEGGEGRGTMQFAFFRSLAQ